MTVKALAAGIASVAAIGAAAGGMATAVHDVSTAARPQVTPVVFGVPVPLAPWPAPELPTPYPPTADQISKICAQVTDPGVSYHNKNSPVQGGITTAEGHATDRALDQAYRDGKFPLRFNASNIRPINATVVTADVAISGPKLVEPMVLNLSFVDEAGWIISHDSAMLLLKEVTS